MRFYGLEKLQATIERERESEVSAAVLILLPI